MKMNTQTKEIGPEPALKEMSTDALERKIAQEADFAQNACNLSGVVRSFARVTEILWELSRRQSPQSGNMEDVNRHPVSVYFASKIASLTGCEDFETFSIAFDWIENKKGG